MALRIENPEMFIAGTEALVLGLDTSMRALNGSDSAKKIQENLMNLGYDVGSAGADGFLTSRAEGLSNTQTAIAQFMLDLGLNPEIENMADIFTLLNTAVEHKNKSGQQIKTDTEFATSEEGLVLRTTNWGYDFVSSVRDTSNERKLEGQSVVAGLLKADLNSKEDRMALQQQLNDLGFDVGGVDGAIGPKTSRGILDYIATNPTSLDTINIKTFETALSKARPDDLASFREKLMNSPEVYDALKTKIESVGDLSQASKEEISSIQIGLKAFGLYNMRVDGITGRGTRGGLEQFASLERPGPVIAGGLSIGEPDETQTVTNDSEIIVETLPQEETRIGQAFNITRDLPTIDEMAANNGITTAFSAATVPQPKIPVVAEAPVKEIKPVISSVDSFVAASVMPDIIRNTPSEDQIRVQQANEVLVEGPATTLQPLLENSDNVLGMVQSHMRMLSLLNQQAGTPLTKEELKQIGQDFEIALASGNADSIQDALDHIEVRQAIILNTSTGAEISTSFAHMAATLPKIDDFRSNLGLSTETPADRVLEEVFITSPEAQLALQ